MRCGIAQSTVTATKNVRVYVKSFLAK